MDMLRSLVSFRRNTYKDAQGSIDLTYVTPQLIVASMPTTAYWETYYRTGVEELRKFLQNHHGENWHIWNLQMPDERGYNEEDFAFKVTLRPVPDHCAIPFGLLIAIVREINDYLVQNSNNVALIHCKAGQGRSGSVACAYLQVYHHHTFETANSMFSLKRIRPFMGPGVSIASQVRYLRYIDDWNASGQFPLDALQHMRVQLRCIVLRNPLSMDFKVRVADFGSEYVVHNEAEWTTDQRTSSSGSSIIVLRPSRSAPLWLAPDIQLTFTRSVSVAGVNLTHTAASAWFNAFMETARLAAAETVRIPTSAAPTPSMSPESPLKGRFSCNWANFEGFWGTSLRGPPAFESMEVYWQ